MQPGKYENMQFTYNALGQRLSKYYTYDKNTADLDAERYTYNTNYTYDSLGRLIYEKCTETQNGVNSSRELTYLYDECGMIGVMYSYNGATSQPYYFHKNLQGDVIAIYDASGNLKAEYAYDAYGNCRILNSTAGDLARNNPIRYRSYYLDRETGFYFLTTRYYNPEWRRFISPDSTDYLDPESVNGLNLFAYCGNDPVNYSDPTGCAPEWLKWLGIGAAILGGILVIGAITVLTAGVGTTVLAGTLAGAVLHGAAVGTLIGAGVGVVAGGIIGGAVSDWSAEGILIGMGIGFGGGALIGAVVGGTVGGLQYGTFASKSSLSTHLTKHGTKMGYTNAKEYAKGSKYVIKNGTKVTYTYRGKLTTGFVRFLGQNGGANYAFVGMHGSRVATFGIRSVSELVKLGISWLVV